MDKVADRWFCVWFALAAGEARRVSRAASPGPGDVAVSTFCEVRKRGLRRAANHPHQHRVRCPRRDRGLAGPQLRDADLKALVHERYRRRFGATSGGFGRRARGPASVRTALEPGAPLSLPVVPQRAPEPMCFPPSFTQAGGPLSSASQSAGRGAWWCTELRRGARPVATLGTIEAGRLARDPKSR